MARRTGRHRRSGRRRTGLLRRIGRGTVLAVDRMHGRITAAVVGVAFGGLGAAMLSLEMIGPPPRWGLEALWVQDHRAAIRVLVFSVAVVPACLFAAVALQAGRIGVLLACLGLAALLLWRHPDAVHVIAGVIWARLA